MIFLMLACSTADDTFSTEHSTVICNEAVVINDTITSSEKEMFSKFSEAMKLRRGCANESRQLTAEGCWGKPTIDPETLQITRAWLCG